MLLGILLLSLAKAASFQSEKQHYASLKKKDDLLMTLYVDHLPSLQLEGEWNAQHARWIWLIQIEHPKMIDLDLLWRSIDEGDLQLLKDLIDYGSRPTIYQVFLKYLRRYRFKHFGFLKKELLDLLNALKDENYRYYLPFFLAPLLSDHSHGHPLLDRPNFDYMGSLQLLQVKLLLWLENYPELRDLNFLERPYIGGFFDLELVALFAKKHQLNMAPWLAKQSDPNRKLVAWFQSDTPPDDFLFRQNIHPSEIELTNTRLDWACSFLLVLLERHAPWVLVHKERIRPVVWIKLFYSHPHLIDAKYLPHLMPPIRQLILRHPRLTVKWAPILRMLIQKYGRDTVVGAMREAQYPEESYTYITIVDTCSLSHALFLMDAHLPTQLISTEQAAWLTYYILQGDALPPLMIQSMLCYEG